MCYLCGKYYKPITVQHYIVYCACWVPRLTLLDLQTGLETISLSCIWFLNIFSHSMAVHFLDYIPCSNKALNFHVVPFIYFCCCCSLFFVSYLRNCLLIQSMKMYGYRVTFKGFIALALKFRSLINFHLMLCIPYMIGVQVHSFAFAYSVVLHQWGSNCSFLIELVLSLL